MLLSIKNLHASVNNKPILKGLDLTITQGEVHAIMGPNGAGKSTLSNILAGKKGYDVTQGEILFNDQNLLTLDVSARALQGLFLAMQYPVELPGVNNTYFLKTAYNKLRAIRGEPLLDAIDFMNLIKEKLKLLEMDEKFLTRNVNEGFSGGEKKRNEILQMLVLEPIFTILDEIDSGLDIDALRLVAKGVQHLRDQTRSFLVITHYQRLLDYLEPDFVHVLLDGRIIQSGTKALAKELDVKGYGWLG